MTSIIANSYHETPKWYRSLHDKWSGGVIDNTYHLNFERWMLHMYGVKVIFTSYARIIIFDEKELFKRLVTS